MESKGQIVVRSWSRLVSWYSLGSRPSRAAVHSSMIRDFPGQVVGIGMRPALPILPSGASPQALYHAHSSHFGEAVATDPQCILLVWTGVQVKSFGAHVREEWLHDINLSTAHQPTWAAEEGSATTSRASDRCGLTTITGW